MKLNRKLWTAALAVAMTTPSAMAAQDTAGMHYTSAAEGFYASIRVRFESNGSKKKDGAANIGNSSSRFGVRGTNDLGAGLEGFYQYEAGVGVDNGSGLSTRVGLVGLRGDFGEVVGGSFWTNSYNWVYGSTDVANVGSGAFAYGGLGSGGDRSFGQGRSKRSVQYTTPDLNGFQAAILVQADSTRDGEGSLSDPTDRLMLTETTRIVGGDRDGEVFSTRTFAVSGKPGGDPKEEINWEVLDELTSSGVHRVPVPASRQPYADNLMRVLPGGTTVTVNVLFEVDTERNPGNPKDDNDIDHWNFSAKYDIAGFSTAFSFSRFADNTAKKGEGLKDGDSWAVKLGYSQDNWYANTWYGQMDDHSGFDDITAFSLAGGITVDKVGVYAVYDTIEEKDIGANGKEKGFSDSYATLGIQYTLGSNSWTWVEYENTDIDAAGSDEADRFTIGMGHSF